MQNPTAERIWILAWAAGQGLALLLLHEGVKALAPAERLFWLIGPLYALALWLPLSLQLLVRHRHEPALWRLLGGFGAVLVSMAAHEGWYVFQPEGHSHYWVGSAIVFCLTVTVGWFVLLPFAQFRLEQGRWRADYPFLFAISWRNALQLAGALGFAGVFWLLLWLWAALFDLLGVKAFVRLFTDPRFAYFATALAFGLGFSLYRLGETAILGVYRASLHLLGWLLPLVALLAVGFLAALAFTGLHPLWKTGHATALMLALQGCVLFLFNAAWQDGTGEPPTPRWLRRPLAWAIALLPVYGGLCAYSLGLRVAQYGWSGDRVWAALLVFMAGFYGLGYARAALRRGGPWMAGVAKINVAAALTLVVLLFATATPLLDPERIGVASQVRRLLAGRVEPAEFDFHYLRFQSGRLGDAALRRLAELEGKEAEPIRRMAAAALAEKDYFGSRAGTRADWTPEEVAARLRVYPDGVKAEESFLRFLAGKLNSEPYFCLEAGDKLRCLLLVVDLNGDGDPEQVILQPPNLSQIYQRRNGDWSYAGSLALADGPYPMEYELERDLMEGKLRIMTPEWRELEIGARRYRVGR